MKKITVFFLSILFIFTISATSYAVSYATNQTNDPEKPWTITFNKKINPKSVQPGLVTIKDPSGVEHDVSITISDDLEKIIVKPDKRYALGTNYRLTVSKAITSAQGKPLQEDVIMDFVYEGTFVHNLQAVLNPLVTDLKVQTDKTVTSTTVTLNGSQESSMIKTGETSYSKGIQGLAAGDQLVVKAYDKNGKLLEEQLIEMTE